MFITYRNRANGTVTRAYFERHTMSRTMRRYTGQEIIDYEFTPSPIRLAGSKTANAYRCEILDSNVHMLMTGR